MAQFNEQKLPDFARIRRGLAKGKRLYVELLPDIAQSPAFDLVAPDKRDRQKLLATAQVDLREIRGYAWIDVDVPCIVLAQGYYEQGRPLDLYLDLLHELTHLRQLAHGADLWDESYAYVDRPTEIEGYSVAVSEGRRLGMSDAQVLQHLSNPWMSPDDVQRLLRNIERFLRGR